MKYQIFLRPAVSIVFGFIGVLIARSGTPPEIFAVTGKYFLFVAFLAFATLGFILPDILELAGKAGIAVLAKQIASHLPTRGNVPRINFRRSRRNSSHHQYPMILDTSALIDGRILDVAKAGFAAGTFLVIPSVISELHKLSDSSDEKKRVRGRRGLDLLRAMQEEKSIKVEVLGSEPKEEEVDDKLVVLAKKLKAKVVTVDFNLNKVAGVRRVPVLNVNELAGAVKMVILPHELVRSLEIVAVGKEKDQGVGYLDDGTMIVVEDGAKFVGKKADVLVLRVLQTVAGKMVFGKVAE